MTRGHNPESLSDSPIDKLHPNTRLVATLAVLVFATIVHSPVVLGTALIAAAVLVLLARLPSADLRHRLLHLEGFMIVLLALLPFTVPGRPLFAVGPIVATNEGLIRALTVVIKVNICTLTVFALLGSLDPVRIGQAAMTLGVPSKLVKLFLFTVRYVSVFRDETSRLAEAMRARAFRPRSNLHTWRTFGNLAGTMVVRSLERAQRVDEAMRCRGFAGNMPTVPVGPVRHYDVAFASFFLCAIVGLLVVEFAA
ncbi:cobalt ECF transporter T component CbiQ [Mesorhizobium sp. ANAO-SY3R2]|uniref:cobalt ECF transporter T component CbiQ n=1 Tax=Mesorhizobium sp. ANAO-SY3R2 TaxID=3166644 RepID=UPI00367286D5